MLTNVQDSAKESIISDEAKKELLSEMMIEHSEINRVKESIENVLLCYLETEQADDNTERLQIVRDYRSVMILLRQF